MLTNRFNKLVEILLVKPLPRLQRRRHDFIERDPENPFARIGRFSLSG